MSILPLYFSGNYEIVIGVVFVSKIVCLFIISVFETWFLKHDYIHEVVKI